MKQLLLTLLCVITIAGCNNTTEPVIPDAVTYSNLGYLPLDTKIKYVFRDGGKDTTYQIYLDDVSNFPDLYYKYNVNGFDKTYRYEYTLKLGYWESFHLMSFGVEDTISNIEPNTDIAVSSYGKYGDTRYGLLYKNSIHGNFTNYDTKYSYTTLTYQSELIINNLRYKDIMVLTETSTIPGYYFQNKYFFAKGVGIIKLSITDNYKQTATMELQRTYK